MASRLALRVRGHGIFRTSLLLVGLLAAASAVALADSPVAPAKPAPVPAVDLDLLLNQLFPLVKDPAFNSLGVRKGEELTRAVLERLPVGRRAEIALGLADARMGTAMIFSVPATLDAYVLDFRRPEDARAFVSAMRAASEQQDATRDGHPDTDRILEATYDKGAGPDGRMPGYVVRKRKTRGNRPFQLLSEVAQLGSIVVMIDVENLVDIGRRELDDAIARVEAALANPDAARKAPSARPVLLRSLGPLTSVRAVGADGSRVPRFNYLVQWEETGGYMSDSGGAEGVALVRVPPHVSCVVKVWAARSATDEPLPWGPASGEFKADSQDAEIRLPTGLALSGTVRDGQGEAVEDVRVVAITTEGERGMPASALPPGGLGVSDAFDAHGQDTSGSDGTFCLQGLGPARYRVTVAPDREWFTVNDVESDAGSEVPVTLVVEKAVAVDVVVLGPDEKPVVGAEVSAFSVRKGRVTSVRWDRDLTFTTDGSGVAHMRGLRPGGNYRLSVRPPKEREDLSSRDQEDWSPEATIVRLDAVGAVKTR